MSITLPLTSSPSCHRQAYQVNLESTPAKLKGPCQKNNAMLRTCLRKKRTPMTITTKKRTPCLSLHHSDPQPPMGPSGAFETGEEAAGEAVAK